MSQIRYRFDKPGHANEQGECIQDTKYFDRRFSILITKMDSEGCQDHKEPLSSKYHSWQPIASSEKVDDGNVNMADELLTFTARHHHLDFLGLNGSNQGQLQEAEGQGGDSRCDGLDRAEVGKQAYACVRDYAYQA